MRAFSKGELVWWTPTSVETESGVQEVKEGMVEVKVGNNNKLAVDRTDSDPIVIDDGEHEWEVPAIELQKQTDKRCPDCESVLFDEPLDRQYQYTCVICKQNLYGFEPTEEKKND